MPYARIATKTLPFVFAAALSTAAQTAPDQPDALDLLKSVESTYGAMNTYSAKVTATMGMDESGAQGKMNMETSMTVTADATGKFRKEIAGMMGMTVVYDGSNMWLYMSAANSYAKLPSNGASVQAGAAGGGMFGGDDAIQEYKNVSRGVKQAKIQRSEKVHVNDADVDCWVVSLEYGASGSEASAAAQAAPGISFRDFGRTRTLWVDKSSYLVYEDDSTTKMTMGNANTPTTTKQTSKVESVTVNDPLSPEVFTFTPPPGAKEMDESKFMPKTAEGPQTKN